MTHSVSTRARAAKLEASGLPRQEVSRQVGVSAKTLHTWFGPNTVFAPKKDPKTIKPWRRIDPVDRACILLLKSLGISYRDVANQYSVSLNTISSIWDRHKKGKDFFAKYGIKFPNPHKEK